VIQLEVFKKFVGDVYTCQLSKIWSPEVDKRRSNPIFMIDGDAAHGRPYHIILNRNGKGEYNERSRNAVLPKGAFCSGAIMVSLCQYT